ncbi:MAG: tetratricopeptide repeat protein [candidate division Zixibacteria bacterium]|nr:tetratricopeptide repeat protein [candidate division Zixibacteria bacterium]
MSKLKIPPKTGAEKIICAGCLLLILIHLVASYFPRERVWGVNLLYYLPPIWRWILVISGLLILVPHINKVVGNFLTNISYRMATRFKKINKYYKYAFLSLIGGIFFWTFRVKTFLLGDSFLRAREINLGGKLSFTAPLDFLLHVKAAKFLSWDAFQTYAVFSVLSGVVFLFLILLLGDMMGKDNKERVLIFLVIITMGTSQLFFGYVESYTLVYVAMTLYIFFSLGYLKNKNGLILPTLFFLLTFSLHLFAITLLPSLLYLIFSKRPETTETEKNKGKLTKLLLSTSMVLIVGAGLFLLQSYNPERKGLGSYLIFPLGKGESFYSLFSFSHLLDLINHQLLVSPVGILILLTTVLAFFKRINLKESVVRFLLVVSICGLAYAFLVDPKLGYPRDWDLSAFTGLGYTFLGLYIFLNYWRGIKTGDLRYVILTLLFTSLISTVPWIYVNATEKKAVTRFEHLLDLDEERSAYGHENLAMYYSKRREWQKEIRHWEKAIALTNNARYITNLAVVYYNLQSYDLALKELERSLKIDSTFDFTHFCMGEIFIQRGRYQKAIAEYRKAIQLRPDITQYYDNLGSLLSNLERYGEAVEVFEQGLKANPGYFPIYRNLGYTYFNLGDLIQAEKYLRLYLQYSPQAEDETEVRQVLRSILPKRFQKPKR